MQQTYTVNGTRYTPKQIEALFDHNEMTNGDHYIIYLGGVKHFAEYRQEQDQYFAPQCSREDANCLALAPEGPDQYRPSIWLPWQA